MDNSISINLEGNNTMNPLSFSWKAFFSDGSILEQYENSIEHKFKEVQENPNKLIRFSLANKDYSQYFIVDLQNGFIIYNNYKNLEIEKKENIRLIYFRRHKVTLTESGKEVEHTITYYLGFQYNDKLGNNRQIVLQIDEQGNFVIGD
jgi:hypothetical protein